MEFLLNLFILAASGPLKVSDVNPRYFADTNGNIVYLTGSHTWSNFKDMGDTDPPAPFDFDSYLDFMQNYNHNFIRLWTWDLTKYSYNRTIIYAEPFPWKRTGPGTALDGKPKFDLSVFNQEYFDRLRNRVMSAGERGIYVSIMLFEGHGLHSSLAPWCWDGHPFNINNNINGINGDPNGDGRGIETHTLQIPEITNIQEAYVRKVIDTVNDLDNVIYEITNESGNYSTEWQYHLINFIHEYEKTKPKRHPVGMTFQWASEMSGSNENLFNSPAEWISPNPEGGYRDDPPASDGSKVILNDTDHLWGIGGNQAWVWKSFCRGLNPLFMDPYRKVSKEDEQKVTWTDHLLQRTYLDDQWEPIRKSLGYTLLYAKRMNLAYAIPRNDLASSGYCLANPGIEYLIYLPDGGEVNVDLSETSEAFNVEWFNPSVGKVIKTETVKGGTNRLLASPFNGDAVLYISNVDERLGKPAPDFDSPATNGKNIKLSDLKGSWVVLYFYPKSFTPGCTAEACALRDGYSEITSIGVVLPGSEPKAVILGVSSDNIETQKRFKEKYNLPFELIADDKLEIIKKYNVLGLTGKTAQRKTFIIDPKGNIAFIFDKVNSSKHDAEVKEVLKRLQDNFIY